MHPECCLFQSSKMTVQQWSTANLNLSLCQKKKRFLYLGTLGHSHSCLIPQSPKSKRGMNCLTVSVEKIQYTWGVQGWYVMKACRGVQRFGKMVSQWCHSTREISTLSVAVWNWKYKKHGAERTIILAARNRYHHQDTHMLLTANTCYKLQWQILVLS